jgi:TctA family transporter
MFIRDILGICWGFNPGLCAQQASTLLLNYTYQLSAFLNRELSEIINTIEMQVQVCIKLWYVKYQILAYSLTKTYLSGYVSA